MRAYSDTAKASKRDVYHAKNKQRVGGTDAYIGNPDDRVTIGRERAGHCSNFTAGFCKLHPQAAHDWRQCVECNDFDMRKENA